MIVIREDTVRQMYIKGGMNEIFVPDGAFVTKEARDYVRDHRLSFKYENEPGEGKIIKHGRETGNSREKPEHMTHLYGSTLVPKNHQRIVLRGKLDTLQAQIIETQILADRLDAYDLIRDLESALSYTRKILASEVKNSPLPEMQLFSKGTDELRERSHNPEKYYGIGHLIPSHLMGEITAKLNLLRTSVRETEIAAISAFLKDGILEREDIIRALNRLSSGFYVLMLKFVSEKANNSGIKEWSGLWL